MLKWITNFTYKIEHQAAKAGTVYQLASLYYRDIIHKEATLANITDKDHVLCIGGGICPFSAILFHQITGAKVTVVDNNTACISKARQAIARLGVKDYVRVFCQDGSCFDGDLREYSVIHFALQVTPLDYVFSKIEKQANPGTRLLVRRPKKSVGGLYNQFCNRVLNESPYTVHKSRNIGSTLLHIKPREPLAHIA